MNYTVVWDEAAEGAFAAIWLASDDRPALTRTALALEHRLRVNPVRAGESREGDERVAFEKPLAVRYRVVDSDVVRIAHIWTYH